MPLRDHFHPPLDHRRHWEGFHATWPVLIVSLLQGKLPPQYFAEPRVHPGSTAEIDVATFEDEGQANGKIDSSNGNGGVATATWAPPRPTLSVATDLPFQDVYEVRVFDEKRQNRLVAAVEIVSPGNKDRPEKRRAFCCKCAGLLQVGVSVVIVDVVTSRVHNLFNEVLDLIGQPSEAPDGEHPSLYAAAIRLVKRGDDWILESWLQPLALGAPLPTMPLWLADELAVPLELEESYERSCGILNLP